MNIVQAMRDPNLFGPWFKAPSWASWVTVLRALFALPMDGDDLDRFQELTGRERAPSKPLSEAWLVVGRRGGKSRIAALIAVFLACFRDYAKVLAPGERGVVMVLAADKRQARVIFRYVEAFITGVPMIQSMLVDTPRKEGLDLNNGISIEIHPANYRSTRGYTIVAALCDEIAFWRSEESSNPDSEVVAALRPGMSTIPGALLLGLSSPYARRGVLWEAFRDHHGQDDSDVLVVKAPTRTMNPSVPQSVIDRAIQKDEASARAEYGAEFRTDVEGFVSREVVEACIVPGRFELPPLGELSYSAFVDPSGGSGDSFTLAIGHRDADVILVDALRERVPPFSPDSVVEEFCELLRSYRVRTVHGDRYAGEWPRERFRVHGIEYAVASKPKSDLYRDLLPALNAGTVELLDHPKAIAQLVGLERRTARGGRDSIDHQRGAHDDSANAIAGVCALLSGEQPAAFTAEAFGRDDVGAASRPWVTGLGLGADRAALGRLSRY